MSNRNAVLACIDDLNEMEQTMAGLYWVIQGKIIASTPSNSFMLEGSDNALFAMSKVVEGLQARAALVRYRLESSID